MTNASTTVRRSRLRRVLVVLGLLAGVLLMAAILALDVFGVGTPSMPEPRPLGKLVSMPQNWPDGWTPGGREWFYHATQGTTIMPYEWLISLERPELRMLRTPDLFVTPEFMSRFGFLPSTPDPRLNPDGKLPIGFAIYHDFRDPIGDKLYNAAPYNAVGLTCAACHTGRLTLPSASGGTVDIRVDGGSAIINLRAFQDALGRAVAYTLYVPLRFPRFAGRVLGNDDTRENRDRLYAALRSWFDEARAIRQAYDQRHVFELVEGGFARTDALSLIGNRVFGPLNPANVAVASAPVNFPMIWDVSWFDWVQYNGSIRKVMVRNIGEALGVGARTNTDTSSPRFLESSVDVANLHRMEDQLGGPRPFGGLRSPRWEDAVKLAGLPPIDPALAERGKDLYGKFCLGCHGPSVADLEADLKSSSPRYWTKPAGPPPFDRRFLKTAFVDLGPLGTDPAEAVDFRYRFAQIPDVDPNASAKQDAAKAVEGDGGATTMVASTTDPRRWITVTAAKGLRLVTEAIRERAYQVAGLTPEQVAQWDRFRNDKRDLPDSDIIVARSAYKARPLDGIWATPPYLHNGSVPNLESLLRPVSERPRTFHLESTAYDTTLVGYKTGGRPSEFVLDTSLPGNYNTGHEFRDLTLAELEIAHMETTHSLTFDFASKLSIDERWARLFGVPLEEYAKMGEDDRRARRRELTIKTLALPESWFAEDVKPPPVWFFGVIGPWLDPDERRAIIEYVKSL